MELISSLNIGFSIVIAPVLFICYALFMKSSNKSIKSICAGGLFLAGVTALQFSHLAGILGQDNPLDGLYYRALLFALPPLFYFFSRLILFPDYRLKLMSLVHFLPLFTVGFLDRELAVPAAFLIGSGYCLWLLKVIYGLKEHRNRFEIEFFFFAFFSVLAIAVLVIGFSASYIDDKYFYHFYANGLAFAFILVTAALIVYPDLLNELTEAVKLSYQTTTLTNVDLDKQLTRLTELMEKEGLYQNENLNLSKLAEAMALSSHQLSELINTHFNMSFSQYLRLIRVEKAKQLLRNEPSSSVLSIGMETGFKSQSNFYAAFKELTGESPGSYRKSHA